MSAIILDPGHGMSNRRARVFDSGAVSNGFREADIVMDWANEIRGFLIDAGRRVVRTRIDNADPAPIGERVSIARRFNGVFMLSLHCNAANGQASGTETFYRGANNRDVAQQINAACVHGMQTRDRGVKLEGQSQHKSLAVLDFSPCFLLEIGFIDHAGDREKMLDARIRRETCQQIARVILRNVR
jgi:N-acetylmuramoyl-L-alanine amidase